MKKTHEELMFAAQVALLAQAKYDSEQARITAICIAMGPEGSGAVILEEFYANNSPKNFVRSAIKEITSAAETIRRARQPQGLTE